MIYLPRRLAAPAPGWTIEVDVVVVGSGVAGLTTALHARAAGYRVLIVTKAQVDEGSTRWAQGGIAAALSPDDSPAEHEVERAHQNGLARTGLTGDDVEAGSKGDGGLLDDGEVTD